MSVISSHLHLDQVYPLRKTCVVPKAVLLDVCVHYFPDICGYFSAKTSFHFSWVSLVRPIMWVLISVEGWHSCVFSIKDVVFALTPYHKWTVTTSAAYYQQYSLNSTLGHATPSLYINTQTAIPLAAVSTCVASDSLILWFSDSLILWFSDSLILWFSDHCLCPCMLLILPLS